MKYIFTYGSEGHPFVGGWTEVEAPKLGTAISVFQAIHPNKADSDCLDCCSIYNEADFNRTPMAGPKGNLGAGCHEKITLTVEVLTK